MILRSRQTWLLMGLLGGLAIFSAYLAGSRIYQVDEAQNIFMARTIGTHETATYFTNAEVWMLGPLAWLARSGTVSADIFFWNRMIFLGVFWGNLLLLAVNTGVRLRSLQGLAVLAGASTLAPLWDYGFEIRHDNLLLMGILLMWYLGRSRPRGTLSYVILGFLAVFMQFVAFKSIAYTVPLSLAFLAFPPSGHKSGHLRLVLAWGAGALLAFLLCRWAYALSGLWALHASGALDIARGSAQGQRFGPWMALSRTLDQTPLLLALTAGGLVALARQVRQTGLKAVGWDGIFPEAFLWVGSLLVLAINPTPFPYNLVNVVPFGFLLGVRFLATAMEGTVQRPLQVALAAGVLVFAHAVPFLTSTWRHLDRPNARQEALMVAAESITDPRQDRVYDAIGMIPTRSSIHANWYLHSLNIQVFHSKGGLRVREMLAANPPSVIIPNYRTNWLPKEDWDFIRGHYIPVAEDFWVLGQMVPKGAATLEVLHSGRYLVFGQAEGVQKPVPGSFLDGKPVTGVVARLEKGAHTLSGLSGNLVVVWVGPKADRPPILGPGDPAALFVNWY